MLNLVQHWAVAQAPTIEWEKYYGGSMWENPRCIQQTSDGGYIVAGQSSSIDGYVSGSHTTDNNGETDIWIIKLNSSGDFQWGKCFGGSFNEDAYCIKQTSDNGFIVAGYTYSNDGDVECQDHGWLLKLNSTGELEWQKCFEFGLNSVIQTSDGGYIVSMGSKLYKLDNIGNMMWEHTYSGVIGSIILTSDGGIAFAGDINSPDTITFLDNYNFWIGKADAAGNLQWEQSYGGSKGDIACSIFESNDNGFIVAGYTSSNDGDVTGFHDSLDYWVIKIDILGNLQWQKCLGGTDEDKALSVVQRFNGNYAVAGHSSSTDGDITAHIGNIFNYWIVELNTLGGLVWEKSIGDANYAPSIIEASDGGLVVAGFSRSWDTGGNNGGDYDIIKFVGGMEQFISVNIFPNPSSGYLLIQAELGFGGEVQTEVKNILGQTIYSSSEIVKERLYKKEMDMNIPQGIYYVTVQTGQGVAVKKFEVVGE